MNHPALRHIRNTLVAALGLTGCIDRAASIGEPASGDAALLDPDPMHCARGVPIFTPDGMQTGYVRCPDGAIDRIGPATCAPVAAGYGCERDGDAEEDGCRADADCAEAAHGRCVGFSSCLCIYACASDADCAPDEVCICDAVGNASSVGSVCRPAACRGPEDCGGARCGVAVFEGGCGTEKAVACRTPGDTCRTSETCPRDDTGWPLQCWPPNDPNAERAWEDPTANGTWACDGPSLLCGRPLRVAAAPRLAPSHRRAGWQAEATLSRPASATLTADDRARLAAHWGAIAALEHASVASFARFSLQLLALGAPSDLVADCQQAAADEVEHARMAYGIASAFAGDDIGPGPLSLDGITLDCDPATVLREVIVEGCIGETFGALEAAEAARSAIDPAIAAACARIAEDELRHAALGWRAARWLLECHPELARMASDAFRDGISHHCDGIEPSSALTLSHGIAVRPALRRAAAVEVIGPLAGRLSRRPGSML